MKKLKTSKIVSLLFVAICILLNANVVPVQAADNFVDGDLIYVNEIVEVVAAESSLSDDDLLVPMIRGLELNHSMQEQFRSTDMIINDVLNKGDTISISWSTVHIEELIKNSEIISVESNGNTTASFTSAKMNTGTPNVKWYYTITYTAAPNANGFGWRIVGIESGKVYVEKSILLYTWANSCIITFSNSFHSFTSSSITVRTDLTFDIWTNSGGWPINTVYTENRSHTTHLSNGQLP